MCFLYKNIYMKKVKSKKVKKAESFSHREEFFNKHKNFEHLMLMFVAVVFAFFMFYILL